VDNARADDTSSLKASVLHYLNVDPSTPLEPPIPSGHYNFKINRGWNHPTTALLLMPIEWDANELYAVQYGLFYYY